MDRNNIKDHEDYINLLVDIVKFYPYDLNIKGNSDSIQIQNTSEIEYFDLFKLKCNMFERFIGLLTPLNYLNFSLTCKQIYYQCLNLRGILSSVFGCLCISPLQLNELLTIDQFSFYESYPDVKLMKYLHCYDCFINEYSFMLINKEEHFACRKFYKKLILKVEYEMQLDEGRNLAEVKTWHKIKFLNNPHLQYLHIIFTVDERIVYENALNGQLIELNNFTLNFNKVMDLLNDFGNVTNFFFAFKHLGNGNYGMQTRIMRNYLENWFEKKRLNTFIMYYKDHLFKLFDKKLKCLKSIDEQKWFYTHDYDEYIDQYQANPNYSQFFALTKFIYPKITYNEDNIYEEIKNLFYEFWDFDHVHLYDYLIQHDPSVTYWEV